MPAATRNCASCALHIPEAEASAVSHNGRNYYYCRVCVHDQVALCWQCHKPQIRRTMLMLSRNAIILTSGPNVSVTRDQMVCRPCHAAFTDKYGTVTNCFFCGAGGLTKAKGWAVGAVACCPLCSQNITAGTKNKCSFCTKGADNSPSVDLVQVLSTTARAASQRALMQATNALPNAFRSVRAYRCAECSGTIQPTTFKVNPSKRTAGFEVECLVPKLTKPGMTAPELALYRLGTVKPDGSIHLRSGDDISEAEGWEFVSRPAAGDVLLTTIDTAMDSLKALGAVVNSTCGLHTHYFMGDTSQEERQNLVRWWPILEPLFWDIIDPNRESNRFCAPGVSTDPGTRYRALNAGAAWSRHRTFEVRMHHGSLDAESLKAWMLIMLRTFDVFTKLATNTPVSIPGNSTSTQPLISVVGAFGRRDLLRFFLMQTQLPLRLSRQLLRTMKKYRRLDRYRYTPLRPTDTVHIKDGCANYVRVDASVPVAVPVAEPTEVGQFLNSLRRQTRSTPSATTTTLTSRYFVSNNPWRT